MKSTSTDINKILEKIKGLRSDSKTAIKPDKIKKLLSLLEKGYGISNKELMKILPNHYTGDKK